MYESIPAELQVLPQWVVWRYVVREEGKKPTKEPLNPHTGYPAATDNPQSWGTFEQACHVAQYERVDGIGFVLTLNDPYAFIDLDTYDETLTADDKDRHRRIFEAFPGYAELSPSGNGLHLIVKGKTIDGRKRSGIELYTSGRYMTMTGNVYRPGPIEDAHFLVNVLWEELGGREEKNNQNTKLNNPQTESDDVVCNRAANAFNGPLFVQLMKGEWQRDYKSQSEADLALVNIIAFYTSNRDQIKRIFRSSELGKREKANKSGDRYFDHPSWGMISKAFDNRVPNIDVEAARLAVEKKLAEVRVSASAAPSAPQEQQAPPPPPVYPMPDTIKPAPRSAYTAPPGLVGEVARYIYDAAPRPVPEIALCAAIGLLAGITGRAYNVSGTGLNQYVLLLAPTGSGKEALASGISLLMSAVTQRVPGAAEFIGPGQIRSDVALLKYLAKTAPSFVTIAGEFAGMLEQMASLNAPAHMKGIKTVLLDLYMKSGRGMVLRPTIYSDADKSTKQIESPAFSLLGESNPDSFYQILDERLVQDGLLTRFTIFEYMGHRPDLNPFANQAPPEQLVQRVAALAANCLQLNANKQAIDVQQEPEADALFRQFELACTSAINSRDATETIRHIWNRAHLRALKLAALIAVGNNPYNPVIDYQMAVWATELSYTNTLALLKKFERGEVGSVSGDDKHSNEVARVIKQFMTRPLGYVKKYAGSLNVDAYYMARVVPYSYINKRLAATTAFRLQQRQSRSRLAISLKAASLFR